MPIELFAELTNYLKDKLRLNTDYWTRTASASASAAVETLQVERLQLRVTSTICGEIFAFTDSESEYAQRKELKSIKYSKQNLRFGQECEVNARLIFNNFYTLFFF